MTDLDVEEQVLRDEILVCECPPEHSVTKLGHCATCPDGKIVVVRPCELMSSSVRPFLQLWICGEKTDHVHDFEWATYADEDESYGVCVCGLDQITHALWTGP